MNAELALDRDAISSRSGSTATAISVPFMGRPSATNNAVRNTLGVYKTR